MFFILRMMFWLAVVALLLPASPGQRQQQASSNFTASALTDRAVSAAMSYCATSPEKCAAGVEGARRLGNLLASQASIFEGSPSSPATQRLTALPPPRPTIP